MPTENKLRVAIFEDNTHLRSSLSFLVNTSDQFKCTDAYPDTSDLLKIWATILLT